MYKYIFFDLDGTLTDSGEGITNSVIYALEKFGIVETDRNKLYKFVGPPLVESFMKFYGLDEVKALVAVDYFREYFREKGIFENKVYDGVLKMLESLKKMGKILVLATSKPELLAKRTLECFGIDAFFDFAYGATFDSSRIKKTDVISYAINQLEASGEAFDKKQIIMVGDRENDILGAKDNGIDSIGVLYGYGSATELKNAGADYIAKNVSDILEIVFKNDSEIIQ